MHSVDIPVYSLPVPKLIYLVAEEDCCIVDFPIGMSYEKETCYVGIFISFAFFPFLLHFSSSSSGSEHIVACLR